MNQNFAIFFAGIGVVLLAIIGLQFWHSSSLEHDLGAANATISQLGDSNAEMKKQIDAQNQAIGNLKVQADAEHARAQVAIAKAEKNAAKADAWAASLQRIKSTGTECGDTFAFIDAYYAGATR